MQLLCKKRRNPYKRANHGSSVITDSMLSDMLRPAWIGDFQVVASSRHVTSNNRRTASHARERRETSHPCWPGQPRKTEVLRQQGKNKNSESRRLKGQERVEKNNKDQQNRPNSCTECAYTTSVTCRLSMGTKEPPVGKQRSARLIWLLVDTARQLPVKTMSIHRSDLQQVFAPMQTGLSESRNAHRV